MISILKTEFFRIKKSKVFWAMLILSVVFPCISIAFYGIIDNSIPDSSFVFQVFGLSPRPLAQSAQYAQTGGFYILFGLICSSILLCKEFSSGTMRNVLLANKSRAQMFFTYFVTALFIGEVYFVADFVFRIGLSAAVFGFETLTTAKIVGGLACSFFLGLLTVAVTQTIMCMFLFSTRNFGATVVVPILLCLLVPGIVELVVTLSMLVGSVKNPSITETMAKISKFIPFTHAKLYNPANIDGVVVSMIVVYEVIIGAGATLLGFFKFKKCDLK